MPLHKRSKPVADNKFFIIQGVDYEIVYFSDAVQEQVLELPDTLAARYIVLSRRMMAIVPNLGMPHSKAMGDGLFEFRLKGAEGIARVFYCAVVNRRIVMLHSFVKKTERTPRRDLVLATSRMKEVKHANS